MMGRAVLKKTLIVLFCSLSTGAVAASPTDMCPTGADGNWVIASARPYSDITALGSEEVHAYIGKKVSVSDRKVVYGDVQCEVTKRSIEKYPDSPSFDPRFPYSIGYDCGNGVDIFGFDVGKSCDRIASGGEGWTFTLRRAKTK